MVQLRNLLVGAGLTAIGAVGTKAAVDYFRNRGQEEPADEAQGDQQATSHEEVAYVVVEPESVQDFLDKTFGDPGRYIPSRSPKVFEYQDEDYMVIWARDNKQDKHQMLIFHYTDQGRKMIGSVGYTSSVTDYNLNLSDTPFAVEVNGQKLRGGKGETQGSNDVDFVLA